MVFITKSVWIEDHVDNTFNFTFDTLGRKTGLQDPDTDNWIYEYDLSGNLIQQSGGGGNLITGDGYYREYNDYGQLVKIRSGGNSSGTLLEEYYYDHDGQRIKTRINDTVNTIIYTPFKEFMQIRNSTGTYDFKYIYQDNQLVAKVNSDGTKYFYHPDHLGSTTLITDSSGFAVENTTYTPFGEEVLGGNLDFKGYTGQFDDEPTGQMYYGTRYYKPQTGQFIQADPTVQYLYNPQSLNRYSYVRNNPYRYIDPSGLFTLELGGSISGGLGSIYPLAGTIGGGLVLSYDDASGMIQFGLYGSKGAGVMVGFPGGSGSADLAYSPSNKFVQDVSGEGVAVGVEAPIYPGVVAGVGMSHNKDANGNIDYSNPTITGSVGGGGKASGFAYGTSTGTATLGSISLKNSNNQAANANQAGAVAGQNSQPTNPRLAQDQNKIDQALGRIRETVNRVTNSIRNFFGGGKKK